jgi:hypothetical protein
LNNIKRKLGQRKSRVAVSEVMGAVLMMGVTLAVGFAAWAWASNAAVASEKSFGNSVNSNINCLSMSYEGVDVNFSSTSSSVLTVWYYNNGQSEIALRDLIISNSSWAYTYTPSPTPILYIQNVGLVTITLPTSLSKSVLYTIKTVGVNTTTIGSGKSAVTYSCGTVSSTYQQITPDTSPI